jgi:hypothetical protein
MISPTVGRVVLFYKWTEGGGFKGPLAAHVAYVYNDGQVNLMVIDELGNPRSEIAVPLYQDDYSPPTGDYCCWMPYQKGQAAKTEALEKQLQT